MARGRKLRIGQAVLAFAAAFAASSAVVSAQITAEQITIVAGTFGRTGHGPLFDIAPPLRQLCGNASERCDVFCSGTSFGHYMLSRKAVCRVAFRCPDGSLRSVEAAKEELLMIRCQAPRAAGPATEALPPLPYEPPGK